MFLFSVISNCLLLLSHTIYCNVSKHKTRGIYLYKKTILLALFVVFILMLRNLVFEFRFPAYTSFNILSRSRFSPLNQFLHLGCSFKLVLRCFFLYLQWLVLKYIFPLQSVQMQMSFCTVFSLILTENEDLLPLYTP